MIQDVKRINVGTARKHLKADLAGPDDCQALAKYCWLITLQDSGVSQDWYAAQLDSLDIERFEELRVAYSLLEFTQVAQGKHQTKYNWDVTLEEYLVEKSSDVMFFDRLYGRIR